MRPLFNFFILTLIVTFAYAPAWGQSPGDPVSPRAQIWSEDVKAAYVNAEQFLLVQNQPEQTLRIAKDLLTETLQPHEREALLRLSSAAHMTLGDAFHAADALEMVARTRPLKPTDETRQLLATAVSLYRSDKAFSKANRLIRLWERIGGNPIEFAEYLRKADQLLIFEFEPVTMGGDPNPLDLVRTPAPAPKLPAAYDGLESAPTCTVSLSVDVRGDPYDIKPRCEESSLAEAAVEYVASLTFHGKIVRGERVPRHDLRFPVTFVSDEE